MKQVIRKGLKEMLVDEVPDPEVKPHHVLVRPVYSLISSGTETASIHQEGVLRAVGENPSQLLKLWDIAKVQGPLRMLREASAKLSEYAVLGYSGAGVVVETHPSVRELAIGDRVAYGGEGTGHGECLLVGQNLAARMPETVSYRDACFATLGSIAMNAVRQANIGVGDIVAVVGLGLVGQLVSQVVRCQGGVVVTTDLRPERLSLAKELGAEHGFSAGEGLREAIASITGGRGADCVIIAAAAKSAAPCQQALEICRDRGTIVVVGAVEMVFPWYEMYVKEIRLFMARAYGPGSYDPLYEKQGVDYPVSYIRWTEKRNMEEFLHLIRKGAVRVEPLITHEYSLEEATKAYETILDRTSGSLAVVLRYPAAESRDPAREYVPQRTVFVARVGIAALPSALLWLVLETLQSGSIFQLWGEFRECAST